MKWLNRRECAETLAEAAVNALIKEVNLTPKPGLVDQAGSGSHQDMNAALMVKSAHSLYGTFYAMAEAGYGRRPSQILREQIAEIGRAGEEKMLKATGGVNTHKGAIWSLGLLTTAFAGKEHEGSIESVTHAAGKIASYEDRWIPHEPSNGERVIKKYNVDGAKAQAQSGFPQIVNIGLPAWKHYRSLGHSDSMALLYSLISMMADLNDTCILHRGGMEVLRQTKEKSRQIIAAGGPADADGWKQLLELDHYLVKHRASPGGSADLLAAVIYLKEIVLEEEPRKKAAVQLAY